MNFRRRGKIPRVGERQVSEKTDPDYHDKRLAWMASTLIALTPQWREVFLQGLEASDLKLLRERGLL